jgi:hypothetical protein
VDPVLVNSLMHVARQLHDSIDATSFDDERRQLGVLITAFIRKVGFGADFEAQLSFYVDCRAAFVNLDAVHSTLVLGVTQLMMSTRLLVRGRHTKKTGAFERACAAFVFITVPTIEAPLMRIKLNLLRYPRLQFYLYSGELDTFGPQEANAEEVRLFGSRVTYRPYKSGHGDYFEEPQTWKDLLSTQ